MKMHTDEDGRVHVTVNMGGNHSGSFSFVPLRTIKRRLDAEEYYRYVPAGTPFRWIEPYEKGD